MAAASMARGRRAANGHGRSGVAGLLAYLVAWAIIPLGQLLGLERAITIEFRPWAGAALSADPQSVHPGAEHGQQMCERAHAAIGQEPVPPSAAGATTATGPSQAVERSACACGWRYS